MGRLEGLAPLPVFVSLVLRHVVLQTLRVEPGADSVTFTVPWEQIDAQFGTVRVRVIDAETKVPLTKATASISDSQAGGEKPDADGVFALPHQKPGLLDLELRCEGYERWVSLVDLPPTVALDHVTHIAGTVRDPTASR